MHTGEFDTFSNAFNNVLDTEKIAWLIANREKLELIAKSEKQTPFNILLDLITKTVKKNKELAAEIFKNHLHYIDYYDLPRIWRYFNNDFARDIINAWDRQTDGTYLTTIAIEEIAIYIKDSDLLGFCQRHEARIRELATKENTIACKVIANIISKREKPLAVDLARQLLMPFIDGITGWNHFIYIRNCLTKNKCADALSPVFLAWAEQNNLEPLNYYDVNQYFGFILLDKEKVAFLTLFLKNIDKYMRETNTSALKTILGLYLYIDTEQCATDFAMACFPYVRNENDYNELKDRWLKMVTHIQVKNKTYNNYEITQKEHEFYVKFQQFEEKKQRSETTQLAKNNNVFFNSEIKPSQATQRQTHHYHTDENKGQNRHCK